MFQILLIHLKKKKVTVKKKKKNSETTGISEYCNLFDNSS